MSKPSSRKRTKPRVVTGMESVALSKAEFKRRYLERFYDQAFEDVRKK